MSMNIAALRGRLVMKTELARTDSGKTFTTGRIAVPRNFTNKDGERPTDFFRFVLWGKQAQNFVELVDQGDRIGLDGHLQSSSYEKDGYTHFVTDIYVDHFDLIETRQDKEILRHQLAENELVSDGNDEVVVTDDDLPF
ncbi:Single-stranded DNA-binding protein ssb [Fructobacillus sp. EFB-N1]|uniref:single-stranded DNA-binding protein n=1 Tax=Fructobacillus sp. EFB-N1 TaxID=1658766 RepID=UPI00065CDDC8|nr:single-stranded DNA-binding protein [Fructobacillus sp. EFB-N1]KMK53678.1 Single-stranded DNA-binding protein ssb [Fructobacillus sp. EFB-N1]